MLCARRAVSALSRGVTSLRVAKLELEGSEGHCMPAAPRCVCPTPAYVIVTHTEARVDPVPHLELEEDLARDVQWTDDISRAAYLRSTPQGRSLSSL